MQLQNHQPDGCVPRAVIISVALFGPVRKHAYSRIQRQGSVFMAAASYLTVLWLGYPIVWILEAGARKISPTAAGMAYAVLDLLAKPVFTALLFGLHKHLDAHHASLDGEGADERTGGKAKEVTANLAPGQPVQHCASRACAAAAPCCS